MADGTVFIKMDTGSEFKKLIIAPELADELAAAINDYRAREVAKQGLRHYKFLERHKEGV
jgi:hypothetical protein